jgi:hypothetical protein
LDQGLWSNWQLWRQWNKGSAETFGEWATSLCGGSGFDALMGEVASLLVPQMLHNRLPQCAEQVRC